VRRVIRRNVTSKQIRSDWGPDQKWKEEAQSKTFLLSLGEMGTTWQPVGGKKYTFYHLGRKGAQSPPSPQSTEGGKIYRGKKGEHEASFSSEATPAKGKGLASGYSPVLSRKKEESASGKKKGPFHFVSYSQGERENPDYWKRRQEKSKDHPQISKERKGEGKRESDLS